MAELLPVSWSRIHSYLTCPRQYAAFRVHKTAVEEKVAATIWGEEVHEELEHAAKECRPPAPRFIQYAPLLEKVNKLPGEHYIEILLGIDSEGNACEYESPDCMFRCKLDRLTINDVIGVSIDWKTGKRKTEFSRQLELYALVVFAWFPELMRIHSIYVWTQGGKPTTATFTRDQIPRIMADLKSNIFDMTRSYEYDAWPANPSGLCGPNKAGTYLGCSVTSCVHNRRKTK